MNDLIALVSANSEMFIITSLALTLINFVIIVLNVWGVKSLRRKYTKLMGGMEGRNIEQMLLGHLDAVDRAVQKTLALESQYDSLSTVARKSIQRVGLVRFNAFEDTGSDLSFSVALLDDHGDGLVVSSLFGRNETRTYAKPVSKGTSSYHLSAEESSAIQKAFQK